MTLTDDEMARLAEEVAGKLATDIPPSTRDAWIDLLKDDPAKFDRLADAGLVPADAFDTKDNR